MATTTEEELQLLKDLERLKNTMIQQPTKAAITDADLLSDLYRYFVVEIYDPVLPQIFDARWGVRRPSDAYTKSTDELEAIQEFAAKLYTECESFKALLDSADHGPLLKFAKFVITRVDEDKKLQQERDVSSKQLGEEVTSKSNSWRLNMAMDALAIVSDQTQTTATVEQLANYAKTVLDTLKKYNT